MKQIPFYWGPLIENIHNNFQLKQPGIGFDFYFKKLPLNALLIASLLKFSKNIYIFLVLKNIISSTIIFISTYIFVKNNQKNTLFFLLILSVIFIIPYNSYVIFHFVFADHLTSFLVPLLFLALVTESEKNYLYIGIIIFLLYFIKPSTFFICLVIPIIIIFLNNSKKKIIKFVPLIFLFAAIMLWGTYGLKMYGVFPFGKNLLSNNSYDFSAVTNEQFIKIYPNISVDTIDIIQKNEVTMREMNFDSEWDYYEYYNKKNKTYLEENFNEYIKTIPKNYILSFEIR